MTEDQRAQHVPDDVDDFRSDEPAGAEDSPEVSSAVERTGNEAVDAVLDSLDVLDGTPVSEHVRVFEAAHDRLRGTLATAGDNAGAPQG